MPQTLRTTQIRAWNLAGALMVCVVVFKPAAASSSCRRANTMAIRSSLSTNSTRSQIDADRGSQGVAGGVSALSTHAPLADT